MPKTPATSTALRRSSRIRKSRETNAALSERPSKRAKHCVALAVDVPACSGGGLTHVSSSSSRISKRIAAAGLLAREETLLQKEREYEEKMCQLEKRLRSVAESEKDLAQRISQIADQEGRKVLRQLEEHFTCALCYEIMAHPYTLNPGQCGHTFCAICILRWFFSRLHRACGGWHESVDCPICRSLLVITPDHIPRLDITFPFVPNRLAATICESLVQKLADYSDTMNIKPEEDSLRSESNRDRASDCKTLLQIKAEDVQPIQEEDDLAAWREGGSLRAEWLKRDRDGKREMEHMTKEWSSLRSHDFIALRLRLGV